MASRGFLSGGNRWTDHEQSTYYPLRAFRVSSKALCPHLVEHTHGVEGVTPVPSHAGDYDTSRLSGPGDWLVDDSGVGVVHVESGLIEWSQLIIQNV